MIWVPNQLVGAPAGTEVTIDCHTEAYPRAISYWVYENVMLLPTKKYLTELSENSYRAHMRLTIKSLEAKDFGNYKCISKNSLGETEGSIRLYGKLPLLKGLLVFGACGRYSSPNASLHFLAALILHQPPFSPSTTTLRIRNSAFSNAI